MSAKVHLHLLHSHVSALVGHLEVLLGAPSEAAFKEQEMRDLLTRLVKLLGSEHSTEGDHAFFKGLLDQSRLMDWMIMAMTASAEPNNPGGSASSASPAIPGTYRALLRVLTCPVLAEVSLVKHRPRALLKAWTSVSDPTEGPRDGSYNPIPIALACHEVGAAALLSIDSAESKITRLAMTWVEEGRDGILLGRALRQLTRYSSREISVSMLGLLPGLLNIMAADGVFCASCLALQNSTVDCATILLESAQPEDVAAALSGLDTGLINLPYLVQKVLAVDGMEEAFENAGLLASLACMLRLLSRTDLVGAGLDGGVLGLPGREMCWVPDRRLMAKARSFLAEAAAVQIEDYGSEYEDGELKTEPMLRSFDHCPRHLPTRAVLACTRAYRELWLLEDRVDELAPAGIIGRGVFQPTGSLVSLMESNDVLLVALGLPRSPGEIQARVEDGTLKANLEHCLAVAISALAQDERNARRLLASLAALSTDREAAGILAEVCTPHTLSGDGSIYECDCGLSLGFSKASIQEAVRPLLSAVAKALCLGGVPCPACWKQGFGLRKLRSQVIQDLASWLLQPGEVRRAGFTAFYLCCLGDMAEDEAVELAPMLLESMRVLDKDEGRDMAPLLGAQALLLLRFPRRLNESMPWLRDALLLSPRPHLWSAPQQLFSLLLLLLFEAAMARESRDENDRDLPESIRKSLRRIFRWSEEKGDAIPQDGIQTCLDMQIVSGLYAAAGALAGSELVPANLRPLLRSLSSRSPSNRLKDHLPAFVRQALVP